MKQTLSLRIKAALEKDSELLVTRDLAGETFGHNPDYLLDVHGITKSDLIRLERKGLAVKARYVIDKTGEHRTRWIIFQEALSE